MRSLVSVQITLLRIFGIARTSIPLVVSLPLNVSGALPKIRRSNGFGQRFTPSPNSTPPALQQKHGFAGALGRRRLSPVPRRCYLTLVRTPTLRFRATQSFRRGRCFIRGVLNTGLEGTPGQFWRDPRRFRFTIHRLHDRGEIATVYERSESNDSKGILGGTQGRQHNHEQLGTVAGKRSSKISARR